MKRCEEQRLSGRRGSVLVALVVVLAVMQIVVVSTVLSGTRTSELSVLRLESARALYAAEAGANMAAREAFLSLDLDGDGKPGSISDDGNPANDPALGSARFSASVSGAMNVTVTGVAGGTARRISFSIVTP